MISNKNQTDIRKHVMKAQQLKDKAMTALNKGDLQKASLLFNLDARNSDSLSELLKSINNETTKNEIEKIVGV